MSANAASSAFSKWSIRAGILAIFWALCSYLQSINVSCDRGARG